MTDNAEFSNETTDQIQKTHPPFILRITDYDFPIRQEYHQVDISLLQITKMDNKGWPMTRKEYLYSDCNQFEYQQGIKQHCPICNSEMPDIGYSKPETCPVCLVQFEYDEGPVPVFDEATKELIKNRNKSGQ